MIYENMYNELLKKANKKNKAVKDENGQTETEFLKDYKPSDYERPSVTVDMLIFTVDNDELKLLLIKRKNHPYMNHWAIPGGFVDINESADDAAKRELKEETSLENIYMEQLFTWSNPNRDPRMRVISTSYLALVNKEGLNPIAGDDAEDVAWFSVKKKITNVDKEGVAYFDLILRNDELDLEIDAKVFDIPKNNGVITTSEVKVVQVSDDKMAFDHAEIINMAIDRLRNKVEYTPIAFNLVNEKFTLPELQKIHEILLDKPLYKANFRNKIMPMVIELDENKSTSRRSAKLYKYNKFWNIVK